MTKLEVKYRLEGKALAPRPIRVALPGWGGSAEMKKENGSQPQPWHCPLHVEGCTHGFELVYPFETECHVVNDGQVRILWDRAKEPGLAPGPSEFTLSTPPPPQNYLYATGLDIQAPPGYALRTESHPRFFADTTGTVPAVGVGHVHSEWWPKKLFVVFKVPAPGQRHIFRKGEPYAQILFIPEISYELKRMTPQEQERRQKLEDDIRLSKSLIARHVWHSAGGIEFNDHYKVLTRAYERDGMAGVEAAVRQGRERYDTLVPRDKSLLEYFNLIKEYHQQGKRTETKELLHHVMRLYPDNAEVYNRIGLLEWELGVHEDAVMSVRRAISLQPRWAPYHNNLGEMLRLLGRLEEAEKELLFSLELDPSDADVMAALGLTTAQRGRINEGLDRCRSATAIRPNLPGPRHMMGVIFAHLGRHAEARSCFEAALACDANFTAAREALKSLPPAQKPAPIGST
jgi:Flp pilus assembly protein TadD